MLTAITDSENIQSAQTLLEQRLQEVLPQRDQSYTIGYQGGNIKTENLLADHRIWFMSSKLENRYWNAFGLASKLNINSSNNIVVEINIPLEGLNKRVSGLFAKDSKTGIPFSYIGARLEEVKRASEKLSSLTGTLNRQFKYKITMT